MEQEGQSSSDPVTALIVRNAKMERIKEFEEGVLEMNQAG